jgi:hypothetical protein
MTITVLKDNERIATYHYKRTKAAREHMRGILSFYRALYAGTKQKITVKRGN